MMLFSSFAHPWIVSVLLAMLSPEQQEELNQANSRFFQTSGPAGEDVSWSQEVRSNEDLKSFPKYINTNTWPRSSRGRKLKKSATQSRMHGVEIRRVDEPHPLAGQLGLFAARRFERFDILGEYCGEVYEGEGGSEYATYLEDRRKKYALGVDATREGNESRFINHFAGIAEAPNVIMQIAYVEEIPRVMIVCRKDIESGEEFLFKYSDEFSELYCS
uniref:SET domain-containing protein n=1 Tax=Corethron hystrix TaxID=216773 RepID=A0A7S1C1U7_9STRA|mmetsp:Transcript_7941/g.17230  ORF Transcript_7941/g.17230 Transcript_7941/m.17230 type:complete len:217 (+) Transcript_7941:269-919(+)